MCNRIGASRYPRKATMTSPRLGIAFLLLLSLSACDIWRCSSVTWDYTLPEAPMQSWVYAPSWEQLASYHEQEFDQDVPMHSHGWLMIPPHIRSATVDLLADGWAHVIAYETSGGPELVVLEWQRWAWERSQDMPMLDQAAFLPIPEAWRPVPTEQNGGHQK